MAWYSDIANSVLNRVQSQNKQIATFECGFGPSGLPHIGTVAEMIRTKMVIRAFQQISDIPVRWILFADDLDALRKVPDNIPEHKKEIMDQYIGQVVSSIPDPWEEYSSYSEHNIQKLVSLLSDCDIDPSEYELHYASKNYRSGMFNDIMLEISNKVKKIIPIITHDYSDERKKTYFPFLPIRQNKVQQDIYDWNMVSNGKPHPFFTWFGKEKEDAVPDFRPMYITPLVNDEIKCQWKLDWAMRWMYFDVDFEMHGKDLIGSARVGHNICKIMNRVPPVTFMYELFLDEEKKKISKSKGNGIEADEWLSYAPIESLEYFLFQNPVKGRVLHWTTIPQYVDLYNKELQNENSEFISFMYGNDRPEQIGITYSMLLTLVSSLGSNDPDVIWSYVEKNVSIVRNSTVDKMISGSIKYYETFVFPNKKYHIPDEREYNCLSEIRDLMNNYTGDDLRFEIYEIGKRYFKKENLMQYFKLIYEVLLGQTSGPQFHQFVEIIGRKNISEMISVRLNEHNI